MFYINKSKVPYIGGVMVGLDQMTKYFADKLISPAFPVIVLPFLNLVNVKNTGAAFGLFKALGNPFFIIISLVAIAFIVFLIFKGKDNNLGMGLILSGAAGNLIDRVSIGHVRDFVDFYVGNYHWPAFNVADSALSVGVVILVWISFFKTETNIK